MELVIVGFPNTFKVKWPEVNHISSELTHRTRIGKAVMATTSEDGPPSVSVAHVRTLTQEALRSIKYPHFLIYQALLQDFFQNWDSTHSTHISSDIKHCCKNFLRTGTVLDELIYVCIHEKKQRVWR